MAEGASASTRELVFTGDQAPDFERLGMYIAYATIDRDNGDDGWWRWLNLSGRRSVSLRPDNVGSSRAMLSFLSDPLELERADRAEQVGELRRRFGDVGWEVPRILAGLTNTDEFYFEDLTQVKAPSWHQGRIVLLGDAAWCVTPIGGGGTSLALIGAYVLAAQLSQVDDETTVEDALAGFEQWLRPLVDDAQKLPPGGPRTMHPKTGLGVSAVRTVLKVAASDPVRNATQRLSPTPGEDRALPPIQ